MLEDLLARFQGRDRLALARLLSLAARGETPPDLAARLPSPPQPARIVAFTGSGGVGKSSLIGKLIDLLHSQGKTVAVLACDPQSTLTGGALLGDRFRMGSRTDDGVFIRSLAARSGQGAVAEHLEIMCRIIEAFGFVVILLETVGAGQGDVAVRELADVMVLLLQPETGDDLQWEKAGVLEVADLVVIHKADLPGADQVADQVRAALELSGPKPIPVLQVSSKAARGLEDLWQIIRACPLRRASHDLAARELLHLAQEILATRLQEMQKSPQLKDLVQAWRAGALPPREAAENLVGLLISTGKV